MSPDTHSSPRYRTKKIGATGTLEHRIYIERDGKPISPFYDIPLFENKEKTVLNMIVEIPRWTNTKYEVS
jgi:inorganic pyrophosphatase